MPSAALNGAEIHFETAGSGPAVVFVHAGIADSRMWDAQVAALAERRRVVRYDVRGYGSSTLPAGPFSHAEDLVALLDTLGIESTALVGASFGGRIALDLAVAHPGRVSALVLVASALGDHDWSAEVAAAETEEEARLDGGDLDGAVEVNVRLWVDGPRRDPSEVPPAVREGVRAMYRRALEIQVAAYASEEPPGPGGWADPPAEARLAEISVPTLVVVGDEDVPDMLAIAERLATAIPEARKAVVAGAAHMVSMERPAELDDLLLSFLAERAGP